MGGKGEAVMVKRRGALMLKRMRKMMSRSEEDETPLSACNLPARLGRFGRRQRVDNLAGKPQSVGTGQRRARERFVEIDGRG